MPTKRLPRIILDQYQTKTKRMLVSTQHNMKVLSECCAKDIRSLGEDHECTGCGAKLSNEDTMNANYVSIVAWRDVLTYEWHSGWGNWLKFWFGLEEGEIEFGWPEED